VSARTAVLVLTLCLVAAGKPTTSPAPTVRHIKGQLIEFSSTDYVWAVICTGESTEVFSAYNSVAARFAAAHLGATLDLELTEIGREKLPSGRVEIEYGLTGASFRGYDSESWWSDVERVLGYDQAVEVFQGLVNSLTKEADGNYAEPRCPPPSPKPAKVRR
jgi:hypothetical protein